MLKTPHFWLIATILTLSLPGLAERVPPGEYDCDGRVVQLADGTYTLFNGSNCLRFLDKLQAELAPYAGKFVTVNYSRVAPPPGYISTVGSHMGPINTITVIADTPADLPMPVVITPTKTTCQFDEPIELAVTITNQSDQDRYVHLGSSHAVLCQDYQQKLTLEPDGHYYNKTPYGLAKVETRRMIQAGQALEFTITSSCMAEPGEYQLLYALESTMQSEIASITVAPPADDEARHAALIKWLGMATQSQRPQIAEELLLKFDDKTGRDEVLRLIAEDDWIPLGFRFTAGYRFAWRHGGQAGAETMTARIKRKGNYSDVFEAFDSGIDLSPHRVEAITDLLACKRATGYKPQGWADLPRVCDIMAHWLAAYCDELTFPIGETEAARDEAIAAIAVQLQKDPAAFTVLQDDPADQEPKDTAPPDD